MSEQENERYVTVLVTDNICPFCHCDNLVLLANKESIFVLLCNKSKVSVKF